MTAAGKPNILWPPEHTARLCELIAADNLSARELADQLNAEFRTSYGRNAVIGKCHRLGLKLPVKPGKKSPNLPMARHRPKPRERFKQQKRLEPTPMPEPSPLPASSNPVTFLRLKPHHCRWIEGDAAGLDTVYCGATQQAGSSYCPDHHERSISTEVRRSRPYIPSRRAA